MELFRVLPLWLLVVVAIEAQITTDCNGGYQCLVAPYDCKGKSCNFIYKWKDNRDNTTEFVIAANIGLLGNNWIAVGFSNDASMGNDNVVACKSTGEVQHYRNTGRLQPRLLNSTNPVIGLSTTQVLKNETWLICSFIRTDAINAQNYFDLRNNYYILAAYGNLNTSGELLYHMKRIASAKSYTFKTQAEETTTPLTWMNITISSNSTSSNGTNSTETPRINSAFNSVFLDYLLPYLMMSAYLILVFIFN